MQLGMPDALLVLLAFFFGAIVHTVAGFGSALVTMPMLTLVAGVEFAAPLQALTSLPLTALIFFQNRSDWRWRESAQLIAASVAGVPVGVWVLVSLPAELVTGFLGVVLLLYGAFELFLARRPRRENPVEGMDDSRWSPGRLVAGFASGVLGGAYTTSGPPIVLYAVIRHWPKDAFKSGLQSVFFIQAIAIVITHAANHLVTVDVMQASVVAIPGMLAGLLAGYLLDQRIKQQQFRQLVFALIIIMGVSLTWRSWF